MEIDTDDDLRDVDDTLTSEASMSEQSGGSRQ